MVSVIVLGSVAAPAPVAAATPKLTIVGAATYTVLPEEARVAVTVQLTATNHMKNTVTRRFFFRSGFVTVLPGTSNFRLTGGLAPPKVSVSSTTDTYTNLKIDFGANLAAGKSTTLVLTFDLPDPGGTPDRPLRISRALVSFPAWAVATPETPGATVDVRFPSGFNVTVRRGPLDGPVSTGPGHEVWSSGILTSPLEFVADIAADRPTEYAEQARTVALSGGPTTVLLRAWPDDPEWRDRVGSLVQRALPILEREIGVPWPVDGELAVHEALVRNTGGYAGIFDPAEGRIDIAYAATDGVILHELTHAWFNGRLVADRWAAEAFASYYAGRVAAALDVDPAAPILPDGPSPAAIPLNAWGPSEIQDVESEAWAYAASLELATRIAERAGPAALQATWAKMALGFGAYQPGAAGGALTPTEPPTEPAPAPPDWRGLLDLLEEQTGEDFGDLWRAWVTRPADVPMLADRAIARGFYVRSVALAGTWRLPPAIRQAMRAWRFDVARELLRAADAVQAQRARLESTAAAAGATLPDQLRATFEGPGGVTAAAAEASAEQAVVDAITEAKAARPAEQGVVERLIIATGLLASDPEQDLGNALQALAQGDLEAAYASALAADAAWSSAARQGRTRIVSSVLLLLALVLFVGLLREQRRRRARASHGQGRP